MIEYSSHVSVMLLTSPIPSHPDTRMIRETINAVNHWFPNADINILADGIRPEQEHRRSQYSAYISNLHDVMPNRAFLRIYKEHVHQTKMVHEAVFNMVRRPLVLFQEHDLPMRIDVDELAMDWEGIVHILEDGQADCVRLMLQESIHPDHEHLMLGRINTGNPWHVPLVKTRQFSGWVHLARADWYRRMLQNVGPYVNCMLEPYMQGQVEAVSWDSARLMIYMPDEKAARRIYHLDGREGEPKWEEQFRYR